MAIRPPYFQEQQQPRCAIAGSRLAKARNSPHHPHPGSLRGPPGGVLVAGEAQTASLRPAVGLAEDPKRTPAKLVQTQAKITVLADAAACGAWPELLSILIAAGDGFQWLGQLERHDHGRPQQWRMLRELEGLLMQAEVVAEGGGFVSCRSPVWQPPLDFIGNGSAPGFRVMDGATNSPLLSLIWPGGWAIWCLEACVGWRISTPGERHQ